MNFSSALTDHLTMSFVYTAILIPIILGVQRLVGERLSPTAKHGLWILLLIRLSLPELPESPLSVFNVARGTSSESTQLPSAIQASSSLPVAPRSIDSDPAEPEALSAGNVSPFLSHPAPDSAMAPQPLERPVSAASQPSPGKSAQNTVNISKTLSSTSSAADNAPPHPVGWQQIALTLWICGVLAFSIQVVVAWTLFRHRFKARNCRVDSTTEPLIEGCHKVLGLKKRVPVFETDLVSSPAVCGLFHPRILLPKNFTQTYTKNQLAHVITHELAHHKRRDALWNIWATAVQIFHWPNPLVWFAQIRMRADRELATDFLALKALRHDQSQAYGETILKSLQSASIQRTIPGLIGISEDRSNLLRRFRMISSFQKHRKYSFVALAAITLSTSALTLTDAKTGSSRSQLPSPTTKPISESKATERAANSDRKTVFHSIDVTVIDEETQNPLPGVTVAYSYIWDRKIQGKVQTDADGQGRLPIYHNDDQPSGLTLRALAPAPYTSQLRSWRIPYRKWSDLPTKHTFYSRPGTTIGGKIVDHENIPVAGARLSLYQPPQNADEYENNAHLNIPFDQGIQTDSLGRWQVTGAPENLRNLTMTVQETTGAQHRFNTGSQFGSIGTPNSGDSIYIVHLRSQDAILRLRPGRDIITKVIGPSGHPVSGARVTEIHGATQKRVGTSMTTDTLGVARFFDRPDREIIYLVQHPDYAISSTIVFLDDSKEIVQVSLSKKQPLRAQVTDNEGRPIANASVDLQTPSNEDIFLDWSTTTDPSGYFGWEEAPHMNCQLRISAPSFQTTVMNVEQLRSSQQVVMDKPKDSRVKLTVNVTDANSGNAIKEFSYALIKELADGFDVPRKGKDGKLEIDVPRTQFTSTLLPRVHSAYHVSVRSADYQESYSRRIALNEKNPIIKIVLKPIPPHLKLSGRTVLQPNGEPARRARLALQSEMGDKPILQVRRGSVEMFNRDHVIEVSTDGKGILPPIAFPELFTGIFIFHPTGTLARGRETLASSSGPLVLQEDGSIKGKLKIGGKSIGNRRVRLSTIRGPESLFSASFSTIIDNEGQFQFDSIPAGPYQLSLTPPDFKSGILTPSYQKNIIVKPGQRSYVDYFHSGIRVKGRLAPEKAGMIADWRHGRYNLTSTSKTKPDIHRPLRHQYVNWKRFYTANHRYVNQALSQITDERRSYYLNIDAGGYFNVEAVPPGDYRFDLTATEPKEQNVSPGWIHEKVIGRLIQAVTVPSGPDRFVFDAGTLRVPIEGQEGLAVPELPSIQSVNQQGELSTKRIQGKTAILHFWAAWAEDGSEWWPALERLRAGDQNEKALTILSFNVDSMKHEMETFLKGTTHTWPIGYLPPDKAAQALRQFGIQSLPATLVVDPTGNVSLNPGNVETLERMIAASQKL